MAYRPPYVSYCYHECITCATYIILNQNSSSYNKSFKVIILVIAFSYVLRLFNTLYFESGCKVLINAEILLAIYVCFFKTECSLCECIRVLGKDETEAQTHVVI